jgi:hypothetical protein
MSIDEFDAIAARLLTAASQLREAIRNGETDDPVAAEDLAQRMERFAASAINGDTSSGIAGIRF